MSKFYKWNVMFMLNCFFGFGFGFVFSLSTKLYHNKMSVWFGNYNRLWLFIFVCEWFWLHVAQKRYKIDCAIACNIVKINLNFAKFKWRKHSLFLTHRHTHIYINTPTNFDITKVATSNQVIWGRSHSTFWLSCRYLWIAPAQMNKKHKYTHTHKKETKKKHNKTKNIFIIVLRFHSLERKCAATAEEIINIGNSKCRKWCRTTQNNTEIYRMQFWLYFRKRLHNPPNMEWKSANERRTKTACIAHIHRETNWTENGFTDAVNSWIDGHNMVHLIGSQNRQSSAILRSARKMFKW